ncbi:MAG: GTPase HflX [Nitrospinae bacterium]|nr:GTPase HflX [Nitrospinota bacterium]
MKISNSDGEKRYGAILVGVVLDSHPLWEIKESLEELSRLADTAGYDTVEKVIQRTERFNPRYFIGSGKAEDLRSLVKDSNAEIVIFDNDLSPTQNRNIEDLTGCCVLDRCGLILEIFRRHAKTREAKTQVELAHLNYTLPRLTRRWGHLSRQRGGIGLREVGETQIEIDRRLIRNRIAKLNRELKTIEKRKETQGKERKDIFTAAFVGYTNAGKSTLMNLLTDSNLLVEDKLFATLDSTIRRLKNSFSPNILITDTVGFINKLPHSLIVSFKSTLDELRKAYLLMKVVDLSDHRFESHMNTIHNVLGELGLTNTPSLWVFNKIDCLTDKDLIPNLRDRYPGSVFTSGIKNIGIEELYDRIRSFFENTMVEGEVLINYANSKVISHIHVIAYVTKEEYLKDGVMINYKISKDKAGLIDVLRRERS